MSDTSDGGCRNGLEPCPALEAAKRIVERDDHPEMVAYPVIVWADQVALARAYLANRRAGQDGRRQAIEDCAKVADAVMNSAEAQYQSNLERGNGEIAAGHSAVRNASAAIAWAIRDLKRALPSQDEGWREIETAPKDGTHLIVWVEWRDTPQQHEGWWDAAAKAWIVLRRGETVQPKAPVSHWLCAMPAPPAKAHGGNEDNSSTAVAVSARTGSDEV